MIKEKEKDHKEKRNDIPKVERQLLKENQDTEITLWKEQNTREFSLRQKEKCFEETKKFRSRQLEELQARQLKQFLEVCALPPSLFEYVHKQRKQSFVFVSAGV